MREKAKQSIACLRGFLRENRDIIDLVVPVLCLLCCCLALLLRVSRHSGQGTSIKILNNGSGCVSLGDLAATGANSVLDD